MERVCPKHFDHGFTPKNDTCHSHLSITQQLCHNFHCNNLKCPYALSGINKYEDVDLFPPRNKLEEFLSEFDPYIKKIFQK